MIITNQNGKPIVYEVRSSNHINEIHREIHTMLFSWLNQVAEITPSLLLSCDRLVHTLLFLIESDEDKFKTISRESELYSFIKELNDDVEYSIFDGLIKFYKLMETYNYK